MFMQVAQQIPNLDRALAEIADKVGASGPMLWAALCRQAKVELAIGLLLWLLWVIVAIPFSLALRKALKEDDDAYGTVSMVLGIGLVVVTLFAVIQTLIGVGAVMNPEYFALKQILGALK